MGRVAYNIYLLLLSGLMACGILWLIINGVASELIVIVLCAILGLIVCIRFCCCDQTVHYPMPTSQYNTQIQNPMHSLPISPRPVPFILIVNAENAMSLGILQTGDRRVTYDR